MPIKLADDLPAFAALAAEGVMVMRETDAVRQDIRPLRIGLLNLMPDKIRAETQIARLIGSTPLQVEMTLIKVSSRNARNTALDHLISFYRSWEDIRTQKFDGFVVTGAPVEHLPFEDVTYWEQLRRIFDWTQTNVHRSFYICWAAQAAVHHFHSVPKRPLAKKAFGVFKHRNLQPTSPYLQGFSDDFAIPVSRWTEVRPEDLPTSVSVLADCQETGLCLLNDATRQAIYMFNHVEYDALSLRDEFLRDRDRADAPFPHHYFPGDDPEAEPRNSWRSHAQLLFGNWINEIYQTTPFDISKIGEPAAK